MGRFVPDEKRRHRLAWLAVGGLFALAVVEAVITDRETRLAYEEHQAAFYAMAAARGGGPSGTFGVRQIVTRWRADEPGVEAGGIDRCPTCHLGVDDLRYDDPTVPALFRTHPRRERLLGAHPVDDLGCTACHRGQGWATTDAAHSGWELVVDEGQERWRRKGDPRWPAPIYAIGEMVAVVIDDRNDRFDVTIGGDEPVRVTLEHRAETPAEGDGGAVGEERLLADLRSGLERALPPELASTYRGAARRRGERFHLGYEIIPGVEAPARSPSLRLDFPTREMARILGFGDQRHVTARRMTVVEAPRPPVVPIRAASAVAEGGPVDGPDGERYVPPSGAHGLQVPGAMRSRLIRGLPATEAGCLRCHRDVPTGGGEGASASPPLAPTLDDGKRLFAELRCAACHAIEGWPAPRRAPPLDEVASEVRPGWLLAWLRDPRGLRAGTTMPNFWPPPLDPVTERPHPPGSPPYARWRERRAEETLAVAAYLYEQGRPGRTRPAEVLGASVEEGERIFETAGCDHCHLAGRRRALWDGRERDPTPSLKSLGDEMDVGGLTRWLAAPPEHLSGAAMTHPALGGREAESVARFLLSRRSAPARAAEVSAEEVAILTDPTRRQEPMVCVVAGVVEMSRASCGAAVIDHYGCHNCHAIPGFEGRELVGPALDGFADRDVTDFDFGEAIADPLQRTPWTFATLKLDAPRLLDHDGAAPRMGDYDLSADEIRALTVFLMGLVSESPKPAFAPSRGAPAGSAVSEDGW